MPETKPAAALAVVAPESQNLAPKSPSSALGSAFDFEPRSWKELWWLCQNLSRTGFFPKAIAGPEQAMAIILAGKDLGLSQMQSLRSISIIEGKISINADAQLGLMLAAGIKFKWTEKSAKRAACHVEREGQEPDDFEFTMEDATLARLTGDRGGKTSNYKLYPAAMLRARCVSIVGRAYCPDILAGVYLRAELDEQAEEDPPEFEDAEIVEQPALAELPRSLDVAEREAQQAARPEAQPEPHAVSSEDDPEPEEDDPEEPENEPDPHSGLTPAEVIAAVEGAQTKEEAVDAAKRGNPRWKGTEAGNSIRAAYDTKIAHLAAIDAKTPPAIEQPSLPLGAPKPTEPRNPMALAGSLEKVLLAAKSETDLDSAERQIRESNLPAEIVPMLFDVAAQQRTSLREAHDSEQAAEISEQAAGYEEWSQKAAQIVSDIESEIDAAGRLKDVHRATAMRVRAMQERNARRIDSASADRLALAAGELEKALLPSKGKRK